MSGESTCPAGNTSCRKHVPAEHMSCGNTSRAACGALGPVTSGTVPRGPRTLLNSDSYPTATTRGRRGSNQEDTVVPAGRLGDHAGTGATGSGHGGDRLGQRRLPQLGEGAVEDARHLHLRHAETLGDLRLGERVVEAPDED